MAPAGWPSEIFLVVTGASELGLTGWWRLIVRPRRQDLWLRARSQDLWRRAISHVITTYAAMLYLGYHLGAKIYGVEISNLGATSPGAEPLGPNLSLSFGGD